MNDNYKANIARAIVGGINYEGVCVSFRVSCLCGGCGPVSATVEGCIENWNQRKHLEQLIQKLGNPSNNENNSNTGPAP